jgi:hypothetical protein
MKRNTLIEHKEVVVVCEKNGHVSMNYNVLLTTLEANARVKLAMIAITLTCANCGKTDHSMETCHNRKRKLPIVPIVKSTELIVGIKIQYVKHENYLFIILV